MRIDIPLIHNGPQVLIHLINSLHVRVRAQITYDILTVYLTGYLVMATSI